MALIWKSIKKLCAVTKRPRMTHFLSLYPSIKIIQLSSSPPSDKNENTFSCLKGS